MPLKAIIDGHEVLAPLLDDVEWDGIKQDVSSGRKTVVMPCCHTRGQLRKSKLGVKHFYHRPAADCNWEPESLQHLKAKSDIIVACRNAGYEASAEVSGPDWRADVLAVKDSLRIAIEVQWSRQCLEETLARQERYRRDGLKGCWFFKKQRNEVPPDIRLPLFYVSPSNDGSFVVSINQRTFPFIPFVEALLSRRVKLSKLAVSKQRQSIRVVFFETDCWRCHKKSHVYYVANPYVCRCGMEIEQQCIVGESDHFDLRTEIRSAVTEFLATEAGEHLRVGVMKHRHSKTMNRSYMSFGCYHCDALFGDFYVNDDSLDARCDENTAPAILETTVSVVKPVVAEMKHWCFSEDEMAHGI